MGEKYFASGKWPHPGIIEHFLRPAWPRSTTACLDRSDGLRVPE